MPRLWNGVEIMSIITDINRVRRHAEMTGERITSFHFNRDDLPRVVLELQLHLAPLYLLRGHTLTSNEISMAILGGKMMFMGIRIDACKVERINDFNYSARRNENLNEWAERMRKRDRYD